MSSILEAHWDKWIAAPNGCFIWCAAHKGLGYGVAKIGAGTAGVHRAICEEAHGPRAPFLQLEASHTCGDARCVRPDHLVWETSAENTARIPPWLRSPPPRGARGKNAPPFTMCKNNPKRPYWVRVTIAGMRHTVGYFTSPEEAIAARNAFLGATLHA